MSEWILGLTLLTCSYRGGKLILGPGLLATIGDVHRRQRKMLNPVFSAAYMRGLTPFFYSIVAKVCRGSIPYSIW